jgi:hypothetical protein
MLIWLRARTEIARAPRFADLVAICCPAAGVNAWSPSNLPRVQIDGDHAVNACRRQQIGNEAGGDRGARARFSVLARVAKVRHHGHDRLSRRSFEGVDHHQKLHEIVVHRRARGLHHEAGDAAYVLIDFDVDLVVREARDLGAAKRRFQIAADLLRESAVRVAGEYGE